MSLSPDCKRVREMAFNYRRGELSAEDMRFVDEHLLDHEECCVFVERIWGMLDHAEALEADEWVDIDGDALFSRIATVLAEDETEDDSSDAAFDDLVARLGSASDDSTVITELEPPERAGRRRGVVIVLAAAAVLLLLGDIALRVAQIRTAPPTGHAVHAVAAWQPSVDDAPELDEIEPSPERRPTALATVEPTDSEVDAVDVFAQPGAIWDLSGDGEDFVLEVSQGTVLVEFLPENDEALEVIAPGVRAQVVGTVFFVDVPEEAPEESEDERTADIGVLVGAVDVEPERGNRVRLSDGAVLERGASVRAIDTDTMEDAGSLVDLALHVERLGALREADEPVELAINVETPEDRSGDDAPVRDSEPEPEEEPESDAVGSDDVPEPTLEVPDPIQEVDPADALRQSYREAMASGTTRRRLETTSRCFVRSPRARARPERSD